MKLEKWLQSIKLAKSFLSERYFERLVFLSIGISLCREYTYLTQIGKPAPQGRYNDLDNTSLTQIGKLLLPREGYNESIT